MRTITTSRGARMLQGGAVLSEVLRRPGPTHSVFDVLAAAAAGIGRGDGLALLGFGGGGLLGPLRALGFDGVVRAVDLDPRGERLSRRVSGGWREPVEFDVDDAGRWLRRRRRRFAVVVEDLSCTGTDGETKPRASVEELPEDIAMRLAPNGVAVTNLLPVPGLGWQALMSAVAQPHRTATWVELADYENRLVIAGPHGPDAREVSRVLGAALRRLHSRVAGRIRVRTLV